MLHGLQQGCMPLCPGVLSPICAGLLDWFLTQAPACQAARTGFCPEPYLWWAAGAVSAPDIPPEQGIWRETTARGLLERCTKLPGLLDSVVCCKARIQYGFKILHYINFEPFLVIWTGNPYCLLDTEKPA